MGRARQRHGGTDVLGDYFRTEPGLVVAGVRRVENGFWKLL